MEFVVKKPEQIKVTNHDGQVYLINKPTFAKMESLAEQIGGEDLSGAKSMKIMKSYIVDLGLPEEVLATWDGDTVFDFIDMILGRKKK